MDAQNFILPDTTAQTNIHALMYIPGCILVINMLEGIYLLLVRLF